jgi:hypothetical protein
MQSGRDGTSFGTVPYGGVGFSNQRGFPPTVPMEESPPPAFGDSVGLNMSQGFTSQSQLGSQGYSSNNFHSQHGFNPGYASANMVGQSSLHGFGSSSSSSQPVILTTEQYQHYQQLLPSQPMPHIPPLPPVPITTTAVPAAVAAATRRTRRVVKCSRCVQAGNVAQAAGHNMASSNCYTSLAAAAAASPPLVAAALPVVGAVGGGGGATPHGSAVPRKSSKNQHNHMQGYAHKLADDPELQASNVRYTLMIEHFIFN